MLLLCAACVALTTAIGVFTVLTNGMAHHIEPYLLHHILIYRQGGIPYSDPRRAPLVWDPYPPVYEWLCAHLPAVPGRPYLAGRLVSFASWAVLILWLGAYVSHKTRSRQAGGLAAALFAGTWPVASWAFLCKVDSLGLCLSVFGMYFLCRRSGACQWTGLLLAALAWWVKPIFVAAPAAALWVLSRTDRRRAMRFAGALASLFIFPAVILEFVTRGGFLWHVFLVQHGFSLYREFDLLNRFAAASIGLILALVLMQSHQAHLTSRSSATIWRPSAPDFEIPYLIAALVVMALTVGYNRSSWNYLLEAHFALALVGGVRLGSLFTGNGSTPWVPVLLSLHLFASLLGIGLRLPRQIAEMSAADRDERLVQTALHGWRGEVFNLVMAPWRKAAVDDALLRLHHTIWCEPFYMEPPRRGDTVSMLRSVVRRRRNVLFVTDSHGINITGVKDNDAVLWMETAGFQFWIRRTNRPGRMSLDNHPPRLGNLYKVRRVSSSVFHENRAARHGDQQGRRGEE